MCKVIAIVNQKGGVGKTTTSINIGVGLARKNKKVLLIDADPQGSMTAALGYVDPDDIEVTLATKIEELMNDSEMDKKEGILKHQEQVDLLPSNIELAGLEVSLINAMSRETLLRRYIEEIKENYDFILIDCMPSLGMLTINALVAADSLIIPVQAAYLPVKGLEQLIRTVVKVKKQLNRRLQIEGILLTMVDKRTNYTKDICLKLYDAYGSTIHIFGTMIPLSVKAAETSAVGSSIFLHDPKGKVATTYEAVVEEVMLSWQKELAEK